MNASAWEWPSSTDTIGTPSSSAPTSASKYVARPREGLVLRLRRQSEVHALARPVGEAAERVEEDPLDLPREGRLEVGDRRQRDPDAGGDHGLVGASLGRQADAGWGRDHDELRAGVER